MVSPRKVTVSDENYCSSRRRIFCTSLFELPLELFKGALDIFAFFYGYYDHSVITSFFFSGCKGNRKILKSNSFSEKIFSCPILKERVDDRRLVFVVEGHDLFLDKGVLEPLDVGGGVERIF